MRNNRPQSGFTLVEVLLAAAIAAVVLGMVYGTYAASRATMSRCGARVKLQTDARALLESLGRELRCCRTGATATAAARPALTRPAGSDRQSDPRSWYATLPHLVD